MSDTEKRYDIAGTGSMVVDAIHMTPRVIGSDQKILLRTGEDGQVVRRLVGGVTLNHLGWARILGLRVAIFGKQADDANGRFLRAGMRRLGIEPQLDLSGSASSFAQVYVDGKGGRAIYMARGATGELSADEIERVHRPVIEAARVVTTEISQVPLAAVRRVLEIARDAGARTVLDLDLPRSDAVPTLGRDADFDAALATADILKPSRSALLGLVEGETDEELARALAERTGARVIALTAGEDGALIWSDGAALRVPAAKVDAVDTTGAGDAFLGGFLAGLRHGLGYADAARLGNACGAACCEQVGAFPEPPAAVRALALGASLGAPVPALPEASLETAGTRVALERFLAVAAREIESVAAGADREAIAAAARLIRDTESAGGRVHVTGIGKPEHVARYAASLFSSTGTPASFLHGTEATHGSVGQLRSGDVLVAISNSGSTPELLATLDAARAIGVSIVAVTARPDSPLARGAESVLVARVAEEGGPLDLAPRSSVLAQTLILAALSVELQEGRDFTRADYNARHPSGELGRRSR